MSEKCILELKVFKINMKPVYIYKIENLLNGKKYIGQTNNINKRKKEHFEHKSKRKRHPKLKAALDKYGKENFSFEILLECSTREEANLKEIEFIKLHNSFGENGYNLTSGGLVGKNRIPWNKGKTGIYSKEYREKISKSLIGTKRHLGKKHTEETKKLIGLIRKGKPGNRKGSTHTEEVKKIISMTHKGKHNSKATEFPSQPCLAIQLETGFSFYFDSLSELTRFINGTSCAVFKVLRGEQKQHKGYKIFREERN